MKKLLEELYMLDRQLINDDTDRTLGIIQRELPQMEIFRVPSGTECWTWIIPEKWTVHEAYISDGVRKIVDFKDHPLHLVSYSLPIDKWVSREELIKHLHVHHSYRADGGYIVPERPKAIPWVFKYYERDWGFCMQKSRLSEIKGDKFYVKIDTEFMPDFLKIGELTIPGKKEEMVVIITNICHPAQVNDSISGVVVAIDVAKRLSKKKNNYTYKFLFLPETIGSIAYLSQNEDLIPKMKYGIFTEMVGHKNSFVLQYSKQQNSKLDRVAEYVLKNEQPNYRTGKFREVICNDEGVFDGPGIDIPTISLSRWPYPEYHTSDDCPDIIFNEMLEQARDIILKIIRILDCDFVPVNKFKGPLFLSRYGLWVNWHESPEKKKMSEDIEKIMMYMDSSLSTFDLADKLNINFDSVVEFLEALWINNLIEKKDCL